jgi:hypothetical protein
MSAPNSPHQNHLSNISLDEVSYHQIFAATPERKQLPTLCQSYQFTSSESPTLVKTKGTLFKVNSPIQKNKFLNMTAVNGFLDRKQSVITYP